MAANRRSNEVRLKELELKMKQLQEQKKTLLSREREEERKQRTRRLIEKGALAEKYFNCENLTPTDFEILLKKIIHIEEVKALIPQIENNSEQ